MDRKLKLLIRKLKQLSETCKCKQFLIDLYFKTRLKITDFTLFNHSWMLTLITECAHLRTGRRGRLSSCCPWDPNLSVRPCRQRTPASTSTPATWSGARRRGSWADRSLLTTQTPGQQLRSVAHANLSASRAEASSAAAQLSLPSRRRVRFSDGRNQGTTSPSFTLPPGGSAARGC